MLTLFVDVLDPRHTYIIVHTRLSIISSLRLCTCPDRSSYRLRHTSKRRASRWATTFPVSTRTSAAATMSALPARKLGNMHFKEQSVLSHTGRNPLSSLSLVYSLVFSSSSSAEMHHEHGYHEAHYRPVHRSPDSTDEYDAVLLLSTHRLTRDLSSYRAPSWISNPPSPASRMSHLPPSHDTRVHPSARPPSSNHVQLHCRRHSVE